MERTFSIIKPDATKRNISGRINQIIEENGLRIIAQKKIKLSSDQAIKFYSIHIKKPFFNVDLIFSPSQLPTRLGIFFASAEIDERKKINKKKFK